MAKKFKLIKLSLLGSNKNYEVSFKDGLNYISGPTSTGKTSILEMINYALGSDTHKDYIEIGQSCTKVELEILIKGIRFKIQRRLFEFKEPVIIFIWDTEKCEYKFLDKLDIDVPSNPKSLSAFLLEKLDLSNIKVANQDFSFRDLFKYSYLKQTEIDNENIMGEKNWTTGIKRKPTFEIIFNIYDELLADLKASLKVKSDELKELQIKKQGINEFLESSGLLDFQTYLEKKSIAEQEILEKQKELHSMKVNGKSNVVSLHLQNEILKNKNNIAKNDKDISDQRSYINKLMLLSNQYISEIDKIDFIIEGFYKLEKVDYITCPSCLQGITKPTDLNICNLCGMEKANTEIDEIFALKHEKKKLLKKHKELVRFIEKEEENLHVLINQVTDMKTKLFSLERKLLHLYKDYVNPFMEQIEELNYDIGELNRILDELDNSRKMFVELDRIESIYINKEKAVCDLKEKIKNSENLAIDKEGLLDDLSNLLNEILKAFKFPKLEDAYIDRKFYLPHVRGRLYRELGSLAGVTLITMAYYLAIAIQGKEETCNHLGLLIIDSPRKNLGANSTEELFKDEEIFNSIIRYFIEIDKNYRNQIQLIVVNNGFPPFLDKTNIIKEFDGDGTKGIQYGLIDDIQG